MPIRIAWHKVSNSLWLRAVREGQYHSSSMDRNARWSDIKEHMNWAKESGMTISYLDNGIVSFDNEQERLMFLLRWA